MFENILMIKSRYKLVSDTANDMIVICFCLHYHIEWQTRVHSQFIQQHILSSMPSPKILQTCTFEGYHTQLSLYKDKNLIDVAFHKKDCMLFTNQTLNTTSRWLSDSGAYTVGCLCTALCTDLAKSKLALDMPVYTTWSACVNFAFDSVYHKLDLSAGLFHYFCKVSANCCNRAWYTPTVWLVWFQGIVTG